MLRKPRVGEIESNWMSYPRWTSHMNSQRKTEGKGPGEEYKVGLLVEP